MDAFVKDGAHFRGNRQEQDGQGRVHLRPSDREVQIKQAGRRAGLI